MSTSPFYKNTGKIALASKISLHFRKQMFAKFMEHMKPTAEHNVIDVGVTSDDQYQESNYFEKLYPYKNRIVCVGTEDGSYLEDKYESIKFRRIEPHQALPFKDKEFDIAFSSAVLEHVGNHEQQAAFIREIMRISKSFFITTPNRWFPVEFHTSIPFLHYLPKTIFRWVLGLFGETYWNKEENLNLLSKKELLSLFPNQTNVLLDRVSMFGIPTNLIAFGNS